MITVHVNDKTYSCKTQKDADKCVNDAVKKHLSHKWFMHLDKIEDIEIAGMKHYDNEKFAAGTRAYNRAAKLRGEREQYIDAHNITEPPRLKITIWHNAIAPQPTPPTQ